nr:fumarylacetoacetate hydrolase family protein [Novosphingobium olei]
MPQGRDGRLIVVSNDLAWYADADHIVPTMQSLLDSWDRYAPLLEALAIELEHGAIPRKRFHEREAAAPLPRAYQWADGSAYVNHVELVRKARGAELPESFWSDPLMYQGGSDDLRGAREPLVLPDEAWGGDFEAEVVVVTGDVDRGASAEAALDAIRLVGLVNDVSLRNLIPGELAKGFGFVQSKPASHFSPVFVTPNTLGAAFQGGKLNHRLSIDLNSQAFGRLQAGEECTFDFGVLIAHLAKTRRVAAGSIIGSGTVSNRDPDGSPGRPVGEGGRGYACIAEQRMVEQILHGEARTPFLRHGDVVRIEVRDAAGHSVFGAIEQTVVPA